MSGDRASALQELQTLTKPLPAMSPPATTPTPPPATPRTDTLTPAPEGDRASALRDLGTLTTPPPKTEVFGPPDSPRRQVTAGLAQRFFGDPSESKPEDPVSGMVRVAGGMATRLWDTLLAGSQGVKTDVEGAKPAPPQQQQLFEEQGRLLPGYYAARDPSTGKIAAFEEPAKGAAIPSVPERIGQVGEVMSAAMPEKLRMPATTELRAPSKAAQLVEDFRKARVDPSVPAVTGSRVPTTATRLFRHLPLSPVGPAMERAEGQIAQGVERTAADFGAAQTPEAGGNIVQNAIARYGADKSQAKTDYGQYWNLMHGARPSPLTNTLARLQELRGRFPNAPGLEGIFQNPTIRTMTEELTPRQVNIPAKTSPVLGPGGQPIVTSPARIIKRGGELSIPELRDLHTRIGNLIEDSSFIPEAIPKAELRRLYGAMGKDLEIAAQKQGPAAVKALQKANINYGVRMKTMEDLEALNKAPSGEAAFARLNQAAQKKIGVGQPGTELLQTAKQNMKPAEWNEFAGATVRNLGKPTAAQAKLPGASEDFSIHAFTNNFSKLSDKAKDLIFGLDVPGSPRSGLETMVRVAQAQTKLGRAAPAGGLMQILETVGTTILAGHFPWAAAAGVTGVYGMSKLMMSPAWTQAMYRMPQVINQGLGKYAAAEQVGNILEQSLKGALPPTMPPDLEEPTQRTMPRPRPPMPEMPRQPYVGASGL